jgi:DNA repair exonuclease SbcCD nuclease subunit
MKFLHTADLQIGMSFRSLGPHADAARAIRLETLRRIAALANERAVDFVLIAGDLFDVATPKVADLGAVSAALLSIAAPVYVLPGNHDPAGPRGPYRHGVWANLRGSNVTTIEENTTLQLPGGGELLASPCLEKYGTEDPTLWFASQEAAAGTIPGPIRIGMAHGALQVGEIARTRTGDIRGHFPIDPSAARRGRLDYLALGDWHGYCEVPNDLAIIAYSGTPEPTSFKQNESGTVSIVTIEAAGSRPQIERVPVAKLRWVARSFEVSDDASVARLNTELLALPDPRNTLLRVTLNGLCAPSAAEQLRGFEGGFRSRFLSFQMEHEYASRPETKAQWLELVPPEFTGVVEKLIAEIGGEREAVAIRALDTLAELSR